MRLECTENDGITTLRFSLSLFPVPLRYAENRTSISLKNLTRHLPFAEALLLQLPPKLRGAGRLLQLSFLGQGHKRSMSPCRLEKASSSQHVPQIFSMPFRSRALLSDNSHPQ